MNNQDYIRKAVELADGFQLDPANNGGTAENGGYHWSFDDDEYPLQIYRDALAAQLVRQVDATKYRVIIAGRYTEIMEDFIDAGKRELVSCIASVKSAGRTMNTIKVIVDSEVLK